MKNPRRAKWMSHRLTHFKNAAELALEMGAHKSTDDFRSLSPARATPRSSPVLENLSGEQRPQ
jgi:hypothetical protein